MKEKNKKRKIFLIKGKLKEKIGIDIVNEAGMNFN